MTGEQQPDWQGNQLVFTYEEEARMAQVLDNVDVVIRARERLITFNSKEYGERFLEDQTHKIQGEAADAEQSVEDQKNTLASSHERGQDSSVWQSIEGKLRAHKREAAYWSDRLTGVDTEAPAELERRAASTRRTIDGLASALGQLYANNRERCAAMKPEALAKVFVGTGWPVMAKRAEEQEDTVLLQARGVEIALADPDLINPSLVKAELRRIDDTFSVLPGYQEPQTPAAWRDLLEAVVNKRLKAVRVSLDREVSGNIRYSSDYFRP